MSLFNAITPTGQKKRGMVATSLRLDWFGSKRIATVFLPAMCNTVTIFPRCKLVHFGCLCVRDFRTAPQYQFKEQQSARDRHPEMPVLRQP
jgi:hypothetical protein